MAKRKARATIRVADGDGGMVPVVDLRFDTAEWPIHIDVPAERADHWMAHLNAECSERGWHSHGLGQLEAAANSGSMVVSTGIAGQSPALEIIWERPRGGSIRVRARPAGTPAPVSRRRKWLSGSRPESVPGWDNSPPSSPGASPLRGAAVAGRALAWGEPPPRPAFPARLVVATGPTSDHRRRRGGGDRLAGR